jgi:alkylhydroperoxidase family enzyme
MRMPRVKLLDESSARVSADALQTVKRLRGGGLAEIDRLTLHSETVALGWVQMFVGLASGCSISLRLREIALLRVGVLTRARYQSFQHRKIALAKAGMTLAEVDAVANWPGSAHFTDKEQAVLAYTDAMTDKVQVPDAVFAALRAHFNESEIVELTANIAGYSMVARFMEALELLPGEREVATSE